MAYWAPHGLIQDQDLEEGYQKAKFSVDAHGNSYDPKEYHTTHLFEDLFNFQLFPRNEGFKFNSQVTPSDKEGQDTACDIATKYVDDSHNWHMFCFSEAKRAKSTSQSRIRAVETQAQGYCKEYLESHQGVELVYANTLVGASIRCWVYRKGDTKLRGFWDGDDKDHFEHYRDIGEDRNQAQLLKAFQNMKSIPPGVLRRGQDHAQVGASSYYASTTIRSNTPIQLYTGQALYQQAMEWNPEPLTGFLSNTPLQSSSILLKENYVQVTLVAPGQDIADNTYRFETKKGGVEKLGSEFQETGGVWAYYSKSGIWYWTQSLDPESGLVKIDVKGKEKESAQRRD